MTGVFCNNCGHRNPEGANFCSSCGSPLEVSGADRTIACSPVDPLQDAPGPQDDVVVDLDEATAGSGVLVVRAGSNAGQRISLELPLTRLGRHPDSDVFLDDITVSRRHAEIERLADGGYEVRDVGLAERHLRERRAGREGPPPQRRRAPDRQVPAGVPGRARRHGVSDNAYLSIGEVLQLLQDEFPDVTISKIRFLESQGLIDPERTPSGYRKFYDPDIERLRFILREQKDSFLPLKVIKDRLDAGEGTGPVVRPLPLPEGTDGESAARRATPAPPDQAVSAADPAGPDAPAPDVAEAVGPAPDGVAAGAPAREPAGAAPGGEGRAGRPVAR